jgi:anion-transporting  ArsA/GET3 family ATPase
MGALRTRVAQTQAILRSDATSLVLVTAPEPRLVTETSALVTALAEVELRLAGVVVNRALSQAALGPDVVPAPLPVALDPAIERRLRRTFEDLQRLARRERATLAPLLTLAGAPILAEVPLLTAAPAALDELIALGRWLVPAASGEPARGRGHG